MTVATRRLEQQLSWIEELVNYFESDKPGKKKWFTRKMKALAEEQQEEVWSVLISRGHKRATGKKMFAKPKMENHHTLAHHVPAPKEKVNRVFISWTDEEWDRLADAVWRARKNNPTESLVGLTKKVMEIFPKDRRRNIRVANELKQLVERLRKRDVALLDTTADLEFAQMQVAELEEKQRSLPSREEVISSLDEEEIVSRFGEKVLENLSPQEVISRYPIEALLTSLPTADAVGFFLRMGMEMFADSQRQLVNAIKALTETVAAKGGMVPSSGNGNKPSMPMPKPKSRLPKVTVVGLLANQQAKIATALEGRAEFNFLDKNRKSDGSAIPDGQDIVLLAANFIKHSMQEAAKKKVKGDTKLVVHHGGVETMIRKLNELLP